MSLEQKILEINSLGYTINNLFQLSPDTWQANLRYVDEVWEFGRGENPLAALTSALEIANKTHPIQTKKATALLEDF